MNGVQGRGRKTGLEEPPSVLGEQDLQASWTSWRPHAGQLQESDSWQTSSELQKRERTSLPLTGNIKAFSRYDKERTAVPGCWGDRERKERGWMKAGRGKREEDFQLLWRRGG